jgi:acyl carrier protein
MNTENKLKEWIQAHVARALTVESATTITLDKPIAEYGLDSVDAVLMAAELEEAFQVEIDPARFIECQSFAELIAIVAATIDKAANGAPAP